MRTVFLIASIIALFVSLVYPSRPITKELDDVWGIDRALAQSNDCPPGFTCDFNLSGDPIDESYKITWDAVPNAKSYIIRECQTLDGPCSGTIASVDASKTTFTPTGMVEQRTYFLQVAAAITGVQFRYSNIVKVVVGGSQSCTAPIAGQLPAPANVQAVPSGTHVNVSWSAIPNCPNATYTIIVAQYDGCTDPFFASCSEEIGAGTCSSNPCSEVITPSGAGNTIVKICVRANFGSLQSNWEGACALASDGQTNAGFQADSQGNFQNVSERGCNCPGWVHPVANAICQAACEVSKALGGIIKFFVDGLLNVAGVSWKPDIRLAGVCWIKLLL